MNDILRQLEAALEPFAAYAKLIPASSPDDQLIIAVAGKQEGARLDAADFRRACEAREAIRQHMAQGGGEPAEIKRLKDRIDTRLNDVLCKMKEGYDDSIVGFNEAWDIVRSFFKEELAKLPTPPLSPPTAEPTEV